MSSLDRPAKRQKRDNFSRIVPVQSRVSDRSSLGSAKLLPLVEKFADVHLMNSEDSIEIIGQIRSLLQRSNSRPDETASIKILENNSSIRKLHGTLVVYLGFLLGSIKQTSISNEKWAEFLSSTVLCLRDLYIRKNVELSELNLEEEFKELFILIPKLLLIVLSEDFSNVVCFRRKTMKITVTACNHIMKSWVNETVVLKKVLSESTVNELECFLLSLLKSETANISASGSEQGSIFEILGRLQSLCDNDSAFHKLLHVALSVTQSHPSLFCGYPSPRFNIFYWKCVSCVIFGGEAKAWKNIDSEIGDRAMITMIPCIESSDHSLSRQALECISDFIQISSYDSHVRLLKLASQNVRTNKRNDRDESLIQTLKCFGFCLKNLYVTEYFIQMKGWEEVFDILICLMFDENDKNVSEMASTVIFPVLEAIIKSQSSSSVHFRKSIDVLLEIMLINHEQILGKAIESLYTLLQNSDCRSRIVESSAVSPDVVNSLSSLASKSFLDNETKKAKLAQSFCILIDDIRKAHFLAMQSSNLAFLVRLANGSYCETNKGRLRELAIYTIIKLARNPSHKRILAKEPGLLSSLIRYTRLVPEGNEVLDEKGVSRKEMKGLILLIANAL